MADLTDLIRDLQALGNIGDAIGDCAKEVRTEMVGLIQSQRDDNGQPWAKRKRGTAPLLVHAGTNLRVVAVGDAVIASISGPDARHSKGLVRGKKRRGIIPTGALPDSWARSFKRALDATFNKLVAK